MIERYLKFCWERPAGIIAIAVALTALFCVLTFGKLSFTADRTALFTASETEKVKLAEFERRFGGWNDLVVVVDGSVTRERERVVGLIASELAEIDSVNDLRSVIELPGLEQMGLYFLSSAELIEIDETLQRYAPLLRSMSTDGWYGFLEFVGRQQGESGHASETRERLSKVWEQAVSGRGGGELEQLFPRLELPTQTYFADGDRRHLIYFRSEEPLTVQGKLRELYPKLGFEGRVVLTGQPLLQAEERRETVRDSLYSTVLAVVVVQVILIFGFREAARPRLAFLSLIFGLLWSVGWAAMSVGSLNIITINFLAITVGLGIDFSIHILSRYSEEQASGVSSIQAMERTLRTTGVENLVGAVATSLAFWALVLTDFLAVQQLGIITGVAVPLCFLSVVTLLPPLLFWREQKGGKSAAFRQREHGLTRVEYALRKAPSKWLVLMTSVVALMLYVGTGVRFDYNLLNMQSTASEAVRFEKESSFNSLAAFVVADTPEEARELKEKLLEQSTVSEVQTIADALPEKVEQKRPLVQSISKRAQKLGSPTFDPGKLPNWNRLQSLTERLKSGTEHEPWVEELGRSGPGPIEDIWTQMQMHLKIELTYLHERLAHQESNLDLQAWKTRIPELGRLSNEDGKTLLRVRCTGTLWERKQLVEFLDQVESVTDKGVGPPFLIREYLEQLRKSYFDAVRYAVIAIVVLLLLHFRALVPTLIALIPKMVGAVGMFFAMAVCGIELNPANCMALPLTLGIGLVFGIHAVHRCLESPDLLLVSGGTGKAITLSAVTTIASFGTLMVATHPGIFSLGFVMATGVAANLMATFLFVPPLIELFRSKTEH